MNLRVIGLVLGVAALGAGCRSAPPGEAVKPPDDEQAANLEVTQALQPAPLAVGVPLQPTFKWKLPGHIGMPTNVSFILREIGPGDAPPETGDGKAGTQIAFCSGLHDSSPTALDLFKPPAGAILTGEIRSMKALKPGTWYQWSVRVMGEEESDEGQSLFRTQAE
jgi:hypothetical protein